MADVLPANACGINGSLKAFHGFRHTLLAERERFEMDGEKMIGSGIVRHLDRLLRRAVGLNPWLISADGHDGELERAFAAQFTEGITPGGVAAENDFLSFPRENVAVVAAIGIVTPAGAPVFHFESFDFDFAVRSVHDGFFTPTQFSGFLQVGIAEKISGGLRRDSVSVVGEIAERGEIQMIHVRVREQHEIDFRQLCGRKGGGDEALRADGADEDIRAGVADEERVGQDIDAVKIEQHGRVTEPGGGDAVGIPEFGRGSEIGLKNFAARLGDEATSCASGHCIGASDPNTSDGCGTGG